MNTQEKILADITQALKDKNTFKLTVLRGVNAAFSNKQIELKLGSGELEEKDAIKIVSSEAKKRKDSIVAFKRGNRSDLVEKEEKELEILMTYLPKQMTRNEIEPIVNAVLADNPQANGNIGAMMKLVMAEVGSGADGKLISEIVREKLNAE